MRHFCVVLSSTFTFCLLFFTSNAHAQMPASSSTTSTPVPGVGHDYLGEIAETVNPATGSTSIRITAAMPPGRGLTLPFAFAYDSNGVNYVSTNSVGNIAWQVASKTIVSTGGWSETVPIVSVSELVWTGYPDGGGRGVPCFGFVNYVYQDPQGNRHNLNLSIYNDVTQSGTCTNDTIHWPIGFDGEIVTQSGEGEWSPIEGAVIASIPNTATGSPVSVTQPDGTLFYFPQNANQDTSGVMATLVEDRNGNVINITPPSSASGPYSYTDTLGRTVLQDSGFATSSETVTIPGLSAPYRVTWTTLPGPNFVDPSTPLSGSCPNFADHQTWNVKAISAVTLPNGKSFSFTYDPAYQEINKVTYPTGGYVRYVWGINPQAEFGYSRNTQAPCSALYGMPVITDRYVSFDGSTEVLHQQFSYSTTWNLTNVYQAFWTSKQTIVTTTDFRSNTSYHTTYNYSPSGAVEPPNTFTPTRQEPVESSIAYYDTNGSLLKTVNKTWANLRLLTSQTTTYPTGQATETAWSYNAREMLTEQDDYDFGSSGVGGLLRKTVTNYQQFANTPLYAAGPSIVNRPCQVLTYDSSGTNRVAETDYFYDGGATGTVCGSAGSASTTGAGGSSLTGHETNYAAGSTYPRGNLTQKTQWLNTGGSSPITTYSYDETGQVLSMTDPCGNVACSDMAGLGHTTTYSYTDSFLNTNSGGFTTTAGSPPSGMITNAYLTEITQPAANGVPLVTKFAYGYDDGELTQSTDQNNQPTTYKYNDSLGRLTETDYPDTGQATLAYNDSVPSVTTTKLINSGTSTSTTMTLDGLNHPIQSQLTTDPMGATSTATVYDGLGRAYESWNPTRCSPPTTNCGSESTWGFATYTYDGLGRIIKVLEPDGATVATSYSANCTTVTDEANKSRKSCVDGLGRMTGAWEDPAGLNYETDYTYDALGDLTYVNQKGSNSANARTRTLQYDSLSRLTSALNPESGTILYVYDANGNLNTKTAPAPNQTGSATVITSYHYDVLNRVAATNYSDGTTPANYYSYDVPPGWATYITNVVGRLANSSNQYGGTNSSQATATLYSYDAMGRITAKWEQTPSMSPGGKFIYSTFDLAGNLTSTTTAAGTVISYGPYNGANRLTTITSSLNDAQHPPTLYSVDPSLGYYPNGALRKASFGNGLTQALAFNNRLQPCRINVNSAGGYFSTCTASVPSGNVLDFTMGYNAGSSDNGNLASWLAVGNQTFSRSYGYDSLNRILSMTDSASGQACKGLSWTIDAWGNMTAQTNTGGTCYTFQVAAGTNNQVTGNQYDAAGNVTYGPGSHHFTYDAENRIIQVDSGSTASYVYNENGERVRKNTGSTWTEYFYGPNGSVQSEYNGSWPFQYVYAGNDLIAQYTSSTTEFVHKDHLGSTRFLTGVNQGIVDSMDYLPFGLQIAGGTTTTHKFTGKERDTESGLDNFEARYFGSGLGRFMSPDPEQIDGFDHLSDPQSWNGYAYVHNNPLNATDPDGLDCIYVNNDTGAYDHTERGDCDNSTEERANSGYYVNGTVDTITENQQGQITGFGGTGENGNLITGAFSPTPLDTSGQLNPTAQAIFSQPVFGYAAGTVDLAARIEYRTASFFFPIAGLLIDQVSGIDSGTSSGVTAAGVSRKPGALGQFKGTDALRRENKMARDIMKDLKLGPEAREAVHEALSEGAQMAGRKLTYQEGLAAVKAVLGLL